MAAKPICFVLERQLVFLAASFAWAKQETECGEDRDNRDNDKKLDERERGTGLSYSSSQLLLTE